MKIHELFVKPVERPIDGVIKADDHRNLQIELEEYVVTRDVARGLGVFEDDLLAAKDDLLSPIKAFMHGQQRKTYDEAIAFLREEEANFVELPPEETQPLRDLAASAHPYRGGAVPAAKAAVAKLRGLLDDLLKADRDKAMAALAEHEARLRATEDFALLDDTAREQALADTRAAHKSIQSARFVTGIRDQINRYIAKTYPEQLKLVHLLTPPVLKIAGDTDAAPAPAPVPVNYTPVTELRPQCKLTYIATQADLELWIEAVRAAAQAELDKGNRISL